jgi:predicted ferric reductase
MTAIEQKQPQPPSLWKYWLIPFGILIFIWGVLPIVAPAFQIGWIASGKAAWYLTRASGTIAYLLMWGSMMWGLLISTKLIKNNVPPPISLAMHNYLSWTAIGLTAFHALILLFDTYYTYTIADLLIPFVGPYNPLWVGIGIIGLYLMLLTSATFYMRQWIGQKNWRKLHYLTFVAYILVTLHGFQAGTDAAMLLGMYIFSSASVLFMTFYRILAK